MEHYFLSKKSKELVSTVILNYNGVNHLKEYLSSHKEDQDHKVIIADNKSTDDSLDFLHATFPEIQTINLKKNFGFAEGYNLAIEKVGCKYIAIVNSDVRVTDNWLDPILKKMENDPTIAAIQPRIRSLSQPEYFEYAGASGGFLDSVGYPLCRGRIMNTVEPDNGQYADSIETFWASGAAMVVRTDIFKKVGGFDSNFFAHMEEIDLSWRLKKAGYKIACVPQSIIYHLGGGTLAYNSSRKVFLNLRNNYWMIIKNKSIGQLFFQLPVRLVLDLAYIFTFLITGKFSNFISGLRGVFFGITGIFTQSNKRKKITYFRKRYSIGAQNKKGVVHSILPFSYYFLNRKKFSEYK